MNSKNKVNILSEDQVENILCAFKCPDLGMLEFFFFFFLKTYVKIRCSTYGDLTEKFSDFVCCLCHFYNLP